MRHWYSSLQGSRRSLMISHYLRLCSISSCCISSPQSNRFPRGSLVVPLNTSLPIKADFAHGDTAGPYGVVARVCGVWRLTRVIPPEVSSTPGVESASRGLGQPSSQNPHKKMRWHEVTKPVATPRRVVMISNHCQTRIRRSGLQTKVLVAILMYPDTYTHPTPTTGEY